MHSNFLERMRNISENYFLNFYFLNVDISLPKQHSKIKLAQLGPTWALPGPTLNAAWVTMPDLSLKLHIYIQDIAVEGTVSQICNILSTAKTY